MILSRVTISVSVKNDQKGLIVGVLFASEAWIGIVVVDGVAKKQKQSSQSISGCCLPSHHIIESYHRVYQKVRERSRAGVPGDDKEEDWS